MWLPALLWRFAALSLAGLVPFPPASPGDLVGHSLCELRPHSSWGIPLHPPFEAHAVFSGDYEVLLLLRNEGPADDHCANRIVSAIEVSRLNEDEHFHLDCWRKSQRRPRYGWRAHLVGKCEPETVLDEPNLIGR
jgi:hypothetical protein